MVMEELAIEGIEVIEQGEGEREGENENEGKDNNSK